MQRTQIYLSDDQHRALAALAKDRRMTASALIRGAIDDYLDAQLSPTDRLARLRVLGSRFSQKASADAQDSAAVVEGLRTSDAARLDSSA